MRLNLFFLCFNRSIYFHLYRSCEIAVYGTAHAEAQYFIISFTLLRTDEEIIQ